MARRYHQSPIVTFLHAWLNEPDTKYNADGLWHTKGILEGEEAEALRKDIDAQCEEALRAHTEKMKPGEAKKWKCHYPYEIEEDPENGNPTGRIAFLFKQNAQIIMEDGSKKPIEIGIVDSEGNPTNVKVFSGDKGKVLYAERVTVATSNKTVGIRLDFCKVMVTEKKAHSGGGAGGFTPEEGGFKATPGNTGYKAPEPSDDNPNEGDY